MYMYTLWYNHVIVEHEMLRKKFPSEPVGRYPIQHIPNKL